ncbi:outer membrane protein assembly factor BamC [Halomonas sp. 18H]|nr:outer membrane protein assembly factor BamC [Halomonas sp. 18H]MCW4149550.1 outer membrane protein assembly factor BamC [Halomonas sp. 18H]
MNAALKWMPLVAVMALAGCAREGYYDNRSVDYAQAEQSEPLVLPDTRNTGRYRNAMPVPDAPGGFAAQGEDFQAPPPRALNVGSGVSAGGVARREAGNQRWLVVGASPGVVWSELEDFVATRGLEVTSRNQRAGQLDTQQGRITVSPGLQPGESEVRCERNAAPQNGCLRALERRFEERSNLASATASGLATQGQMNQQSQPPRLEQRNGEWQLTLPFGLQRAWAELSAQLESDFSVAGRRQLVDQDMAAQTFLVDYLLLSERSRGFWSSVASLDFSEDMTRVRLDLTRQGDGTTLFKAAGTEGDSLADNDIRELLERVGGLLR